MNKLQTDTSATHGKTLMKQDMYLDLLLKIQYLVLI